MDRLAAENLRMARKFGDPAKPPPECLCHACIKEHDIRSPSMPYAALSVSIMIVCEICGNKRCPHANDHRNECTRSNEPNQVGSWTGSEEHPFQAIFDLGKRLAAEREKRILDTLLNRIIGAKQCG